MFDKLLNIGAAFFVAWIFFQNPQLITSLPSDVAQMVSDIASGLASLGE